jgi:hypothetical protein
LTAVDAVLVAIDRLLGRVLDDTAIILNHYPDSANGYGAVAGVPANWPQTLNDRYINLLSHRLGENVEILVEGEAALRDTLAEVRPVSGAKPGLLLDFGMRTLEVYRFEGDGSQKTPYRLTACHAEPCGGEEFDAVFARLLAEELRLESAALDAKTSRLLMQIARGCKEAFSQSQSSSSRGSSGGADGTFRWERMLRMGGGMCTARLQLTRTKFEERAVALLDRFEETVINGAIHVGLQPRDVSHLIVVGGGTGWYFVRPRLKRCFPNAEIPVSAQPEQAVVRGLARAAFQERAGAAPFFAVTTFANPLCPTFVPAEAKPSAWLFPTLAESVGRATSRPSSWTEDRPMPAKPARDSGRTPSRQGFRVIENESYKPNSTPTRTRSITIVEDTPLDTGTAPEDRDGKRQNAKNRRVP